MNVRREDAKIAALGLELAGLIYLAGEGVRFQRTAARKPTFGSRLRHPRKRR